VAPFLKIPDLCLNFACCMVGERTILAASIDIFKTFQRVPLEFVIVFCLVFAAGKTISFSMFQIPVLLKMLFVMFFFLSCPQELSQITDCTEGRKEERKEGRKEGMKE
jgi:hypothetical protein